MEKVEKDLSILSWTNTRAALGNLQKLLSCNGCHELPTSPQYMGRCDHFFCESCILKLDGNYCPICKIPSPPCERNPDIIVRGLVSSVSEMFTLIDGGKIEIHRQSLEAPESLSRPLHESAFPESSFNKPAQSSTKSHGQKDVKLKTDSKLLSTSLNESTEPNLKQIKTKGRQIKTPKNAQNTAKNNEISVKQNNATSSKVKPTGLAVNAPDLNFTPKNASTSKPQDLTVLGITPSTPAVNKRNTKGETLLHCACLKRDFEKVKKLLEDGANPNTKDNAGWTPLHEACSHGFEKIASLLLENGALVDATGNDNMTPLHDAVITGTISVISLLRRWGASDTVRDIWGRSARYLAKFTSGSPGEVLTALNVTQDPFLLPKKVASPLCSKLLILDSNLHVDDKKKLEKVAKLLKMKLGTEFSLDVTHVVVGCDGDRNVCQRTVKYMMGVVSGKWIISHRWLDACLNLGGPVNPADYEVEGSRCSPCSLAPNRGRMKASKMLPGLFSGCHIFFCGTFGEGLPTRKELESLVKAGGGIPLQREPNPESIDESEQTVPYYAPAEGLLAKCSHFCVYAEGQNEPQLKYDMVHIKSLPLSWFYECIDQWSLVEPVR